MSMFGVSAQEAMRGFEAGRHLLAAGGFTVGGSAVDDLLAFVRRCLDEDERVARWLKSEVYGIYPDGHSDAGHAFMGRFDEGRVLAEVEAKRRILDRYADAHWHGAAVPDATSPELRAEETGACRTCVTVRLLAQPYAGQPGWREEWRA